MFINKWGITAGLAAGVFAAHFIFIVDTYTWPTLVLVILLLIFKPSRWQVALTIGLLWTIFQLNTRLNERLEPALASTVHTVEGRIESLPEVFENFTRFQFKPSLSSSSTSLPHIILVYWFRNSPALEPGEPWRLDLRITPPWSRINFQGPDKERWLFAEGIGALATVSAGQRIQSDPALFHGWDSIRQTLRLQIGKILSSNERLGVVLALAIADRSKLQSSQRDVLAQTGTSHLLAISGLHVGLAALLGLWFARPLLMFIPGCWRGRLIYPATLLAGFTTAFIYAGLAGFGTSTVRALVMLSVGLLALLSGRAIHPGQALTVALVSVLLLDPFSVLGAGFWMSFSAVAALMFIFTPRHTACEIKVVQLIRAQAGIMVFLLPLNAWWFQSVSGSGLIANLLAIPWLSLVVVPLVLLGIVALPVFYGLSEYAFIAAGYSAQGLLAVLSVIADIPASSSKLFQPNICSTLLATIGALCLVLPRGITCRWLGLLLFLPLYSPGETLLDSELKLEVLDVGQGTAVLAQSAQHLLIYDTGPGNGLDYDLVDQVIEPAIMQSGHSGPDSFLISHADLDHAGGLGRLMELYPETNVWANLPVPKPGIESCHEPRNWIWEGVNFEVLHPTQYLPYQGNDSSCVLSIRSKNFSILLPGDISETVENRLGSLGLAPHNVLLVPHHGSNTSSSLAFLETVSPDIAIATAGLGNRFGFPRKKVRERYRKLGIPLWSTGECGAIRLKLSGEGQITAHSARRVRKAPWRWPASKNCP
jgi:competence protein ComEC